MFKMLCEKPHLSKVVKVGLASYRCATLLARDQIATSFVEWLFDKPSPFDNQNDDGPSFWYKLATCERCSGVWFTGFWWLVDLIAPNLTGIAAAAGLEVIIVELLGQYEESDNETELVVPFSWEHDDIKFETR